MNGKRGVWEAVEEFREQHLADVGALPVDVLTVIELRLKRDFDTFVAGFQNQFPAWWTNTDLRNALADQLGENYGVHKDVIKCRLDREELWPSP